MLIRGLGLGLRLGLEMMLIRGGGLGSGWMLIRGGGGGKRLRHPVVVWVSER